MKAGKGDNRDEMVGWHHRLNRHEFEYILGVVDGEGGLACCSPWGHKESNKTERLNNHLEQDDLTDKCKANVSNAPGCHDQGTNILSPWSDGDDS